MSSPPTAERTARVYPSLVRTIHVAGVERTAAGLLILAVLLFLFAFSLNWLSVAADLFIALLVFPGLRRATARDPQIVAVYRAHLLRARIYAGQPDCRYPHRNRPATF